MTGTVPEGFYVGLTLLFVSLSGTERINTVQQTDSLLRIITAISALV